MSGFTEFAAICPAEDGLWRLSSPMAFDLVYGDPESRIVVPRDFITDGASIPVALRIIFDRGDSRYMKAAILHDYMLQTGEFTPRQCADAFADALRAAKVKRWRISAMWLAVLFWTAI